MSKFESRWGSVPSAEEKKELSYVYFMLQKQNPAYSLVTYRMNVKKDVDTALASVSMLPDGSINMGINFDMLKQIPDEAKVEIVKITVYKLLSGCLSGMGKDIEKLYGEQLAEMALLMAIHDLVDHQFLEQAGFSIPDPRDFKLPEGRTWSYYCEALKEKAENGELSFAPPEQDGDGEGEGEGEGEEGEGSGNGSGTTMSRGVNNKSKLDKANSKNKKTMPTSTTNAASSQLSDQMSRSMIEDMRNNPQAQNGQGRGLLPGNATEWIDSLFQEPKITWIDHLRMKESGHARVVRTTSRKRPSRRGDLPEYEGRIRRGGLQVWCVIDVSGSRSADVIATAHPEMRDMVTRGADIWLIQVDASVQAVEKFGGEKYEMECFGRGGTDMEEAFRKKEEIIKKTGEAPDFWVIFTDGWTGRLNIPVDEEVLIVLDDTGMKIDEFRKSVCDWPDVIVLDTKPPGLDKLIEDHE